MNYVDLLEVKEVYARGDNVTEYLRKKFNEKGNTSEIIEMAYDIQAGSYISIVESDRKKHSSFVLEIAKKLGNHIASEDSLLDVGTGELTTLSLMLNEIKTKPLQVLAFDISWSRLSKGKIFFEENTTLKNINLETFVADMKHIPLHSKCVDVVTSIHALEPNGHNLHEILSELFRVAKRKLILFEPSYELGSQEGKQRMDRLGYVKGIESAVEKLGGKVSDLVPIENSVNPHNVTACYVIEPPLNDLVHLDKPEFCVPGTNYCLDRSGEFFMSKDTGLVFPIFDGIPILRNQYGILATAKFDL